MKKRWEKELIGWDSARTIRGAQRELAEFVRSERRKAEVDAKEPEVVLSVDVMVFETPGGQWRVETIAPAFEGQNGNFSALERTEALAMAEFRFRLKQELVQARWCSPNEAHRYACRAKVNVCGRVPYQRIQVGAGGGG